MMTEILPLNKYQKLEAFFVSAIFYISITSSMACLQVKLVFLCLLALCMSSSLASSRKRRYTTPSVPRLTDAFPHVSISNVFSKAFGGSNVQVIGNGSMATLVLDKSSGSGLASVNKYHYGFFNAAIKLPAGDSSGVVLAFYANVFPHNHDEIDIELLGHDKNNEWVIQTNIYANGSVSTGREEKFYTWFDPTAQHHHYTIIWNNHHIVFLVDNIPVREFEHKGAFFPSKPMSVYATIWDGSEWATHGGKYGVNYKNAPFTASLEEMEINGCISNPSGSVSTCSKTSSSLDPVEGSEFVKLSDQQVTAMNWARGKQMFYSYCKDTSRFKVMPPECK